MLVRLGTLNVQNTPDISRAKVVTCGRKLREATDIALLQEIAEGEDVDDIQKGLTKQYKIVNESTHNPIVFDLNKWRLASAKECPNGFHHRGVIKVHDGDKSIPTPARHVTWAILKSVRKSNITLAVVNGHPINRNPHRNDLWVEFIDEWQWVVNNLRKAGLTVAWGGDFNKLAYKIPRFNVRQKTLVKHGIDQLYIAEGRGGKAAKYETVLEGRVIKTPSDHELVVARFSLHAA